MNLTDDELDALERSSELGARAAEEIRAARAGRFKVRHGQSRMRDGRPSPTYSAWYSMIRRCTDAKHKSYQRYGARGIRVDTRWMTFENFLADMGDRPDGATLDRFPNRRGNYEPGNVRWASWTAQARNRSSTVLDERKVNEIRGRREHGEQCPSIAARLGVSNTLVHHVINRSIWRDVP